MQIAAMGIGPDRALYFAPSANMRVGCWDPEADEVVLRFIASPFVGEVSAIGFAGERLLLGFADDCGVMSYYPELPYRLLDNPKFLATADIHPARPLGPMVHQANNVYFAIASASAGAICRLNPLDDRLTTFTEILAGYRLTSLTVDRQNDLLVAGSQRVPQPASTALAAPVIFWSPLEERVVANITPFPDADAVVVWAAAGGHIYVTDGGGRFAMLSAQRQSVLLAGEFPLGRIDSLISTQQGELYGLAGGWFFHFNAEMQCIEPLVEASGTLLTEIRPGLFAYTHEGRLYAARLKG